jgi:serine protease Do
MHRFLLFAGFLYALIITFSPPVYAMDPDKILDAKHAVVMVRGYNQSGGLAYGSGVVVAQDKIISNCHILRTTKAPWVNMGEETYPVTSVQADRYHDLCLLTTFNLPIKPVAIGSGKDLKRGQEILSIGHSNGSPAALTSSGSIKTTYAYDGGNVIRSTAPFRMGASGSGLFDLEGQLLGINTFKSPGRVAYFYSLPIEWLANLEKQPVETTFPITGKAFWEEDDNKKPFFMQMAIPEINQDWPKLAQVAENWIAKDPKSSEAWYELGTAQEHLNKLNEAEIAYKEAVKIDSGNIDALLRLGVMAKNKGDSATVNKVEASIATIDPMLAIRYREMLSCEVNC